MAAHSLSIAKASLLASCLRQEHTKLNRDDLTEFHSLLETSILRCTPLDIQNTKSWIVQHFLPSASRTTAWTKYLTSLTKNVDSLSGTTTKCRSCRRQLHLLYLINDISHHVKYHNQDQSVRKSVLDNLVNVIPTIFVHAAVENKKRTTSRLRTLVEIWEKAGYYPAETLERLRSTLATEHHHAEESAAEETKKLVKELPFIMPSTHGDPTAPFYDLPAANLMSHIVPNSARPLRTNDIRALQLQPGPADEGLVNALKDFLKDVKSIDDPYAALEDEGIVPDMDEMGQVYHKNEVDDVVGDTYYGWSRAFCEKMKARSKDNGHARRGRSTSTDSSMSRSRSPRKRRRYSSSRSRSRSSNRSRSLQHFNSGSRKDSPAHAKKMSLTPEPPPRFGNGYEAERPPPPPPPAPMQLPQQQIPQMGGPPFRPPLLGPNGMPLLPPRPPHWQGPWPPPPPPPGSMNMPYPNQGFNQHNYGRR